jgi:cyclopropane fatty-acyl-phospholipid synthase-like methyltransferase
MINNATLMEQFLRNYRFGMVKPYLIGDVLDFGADRGELGKFVKNTYVAVDYDHSAMKGGRFDTIVALAVIEHIAVAEVEKIFIEFKNMLNSGGRIFLTTPTQLAKPILDLLAWTGILDKQNISEHKHYWSRKEMFALAEKCGFSIKRYKKFQIGLDQLAVFEHKYE